MEARPRCVGCVGGDGLWVAGLVLRATFQSPLQLRGEAQDVINGGLYRQCRGEWKLARVASAGDRLWVVGLVLRATFQSPLQLRGEAQDVINGGLYRQCMGTGCCQSEFIQAVYGHRMLSKRVYTVSVGAQGVINCGLYKQCRGEWKLARVASAGGRVADCRVVCDIPGREWSDL